MCTCREREGRVKKRGRDGEQTTVCVREGERLSESVKEVEERVSESEHARYMYRERDCHG